MIRPTRYIDWTGKHRACTSLFESSLDLESVPLSVSRISLNRILQKDLHLHPYKSLIVEALAPSDQTKRLQYDALHTFIWMALVSDNIADAGMKFTRNIKAPKTLKLTESYCMSALSARGISDSYFYKDQRSRPLTNYKAKHFDAKDCFCTGVTGLLRLQPRNLVSTRWGNMSQLQRLWYDNPWNFMAQKHISKRDYISRPHCFLNLSLMDFLPRGYPKNMVNISSHGKFPVQVCKIISSHLYYKTRMYVLQKTINISQLIPLLYFLEAF